MNAGLSVALFTNGSGEVFGAAVDRNSGEPVALPLGACEAAASAASAGKDCQGILSVEDGNLLFAARPVPLPDGHGMVLLGRSVDDILVAELSDSLQMRLTATGVKATVGGEARAAARMSAKTPTLIEVTGKDSLAGFALLMDIEGKPALLMKAVMPRDIYQQGVSTTNITVAAIAVLVALFLLTAFLVIDRLVLNRLGRIAAGVSKIGRTADLRDRLDVSGHDEIASVGVSINTMLASLERSEQRLRESEAQNRAMLHTIREKTDQMETAFREAELASQAKSEFLAAMSHELRTPLTAIIGFSQLLEEKYFGDLNEKQLEYVRDILGSGNHLLEIINDVLDLSKVQAGKMELELAPVNIKDLQESSLAIVRDRAAKNGVRLESETSDELAGLQFMVDRRKVRQVLFNLLSNAVKFTPAGGTINVSSRLDGNEIIVKVRDTGIGIAAQHQKKIFNEFYQIKGGAVDKTPGTGLGLYISKRIVEMHGGRIWVESAGEGKGSMFAFTLPVDVTSRVSRAGVLSQSGRAR